MDLGIAAKQAPKFGAGVLTHILSERLYSATKHVGFNPSHLHALIEEAKVYGAINRVDASKNIGGRSGLEVQFINKANKTVDKYLIQLIGSKQTIFVQQEK